MLNFLLFTSLFFFSAASHLTLLHTFLLLHTHTIASPPGSFFPVSSLICDVLIGPIGAARDGEDEPSGRLLDHLCKVEDAIT